MSNMSRIPVQENSRTFNASVLLGVCFFSVASCWLGSYALGVDSESLKRYFGFRGTQTCSVDGIVMPTWPGEYPYPVVDVTSETELSGLEDLCVQDVVPFLASGLYHPWSQTKAKYAAIVQPSQYNTLEPIRGDNNTSIWLNSTCCRL